MPAGEVISKVFGKTKKKGSGVVLKIILVVTILYTVSMLISLQVRTSAAREDVDALQSELDKQKRLNAEAEELAASEADDAYVAKMAREKLGYILPGERVFEDSQNRR